jgi:hypothetical protein
MPRITRLLAPGPEELTLSAGAMRARVGQAGDAAALEFGAGHGGHADGHGLRGLFAFGRGDHDVVQGLGCLLGLGWRGGLGRSQLRGECLGEQRGGQKGGAGLVHGGRCPGAGMGVTARGADALIMIKNFDCVNKI